MARFVQNGLILDECARVMNLQEQLEATKLSVCGNGRIYFALLTDDTEEQGTLSLQAQLISARESRGIS